MIGGWKGSKHHDGQEKVFFYDIPREMAELQNSLSVIVIFFTSLILSSLQKETIQALFKVLSLLRRFAIIFNLFFQSETFHKSLEVFCSLLERSIFLSADIRWILP